MDKEFLQSHLRARQLLAEMFVGKWKDAIPQELRHEVGLVLFGHGSAACSQRAPNALIRNATERNGMHW